MTHKEETVSFRVTEETFDEFQDVTEDLDRNQSQLIREFVDEFLKYNGAVKVVGSRDKRFASVEGEGFPPKIEVPKSLCREHERLELETEHLREELGEVKQYINHLQGQMNGDAEDTVYLEDLDEENGNLD